uniref:Uncharacterized protein n=2 Tax=Eptatretus burgeri TaxID=7764 RepID=A0A8C4QY35_EPTBU
MEQTSLAEEISTHESWHKENANILASSSSTVDVTQFSWKPTWSILFVLGLSCDLPWSFFSTAMEDFKMRLGPDDHGNFTTTTVNQTKLQEYFNPSLTFINFSSLLIFSGIVSALHQRISERIRIIGSLFAISLLLALVTALIFIPALDKMPHIFFGITMLANFQIAAFVAVLRSSLTSIVGVFPQEYTVPLLSGQGMAGIFAALSKIITLLMYNLDPRMNSLYFFMIAIMFELIAIVCYIILRRLSLYKYYFAKVTHKKESQFAGYRRWEVVLPDLKISTSISVQEKCGTVFKDTPMDEKMEQNDGEQPDSILIVLKQIWPMALNICVNDVANISLFPAVCADVRTSLAPANSLWDKFVCSRWLFSHEDVWVLCWSDVHGFDTFSRKEQLFAPAVGLCANTFHPNDNILQRVSSFSHKLVF